MSEGNGSKRRRLFSFFVTLSLILSTLLIGISIQIPKASAIWLTHDKGNVWVEYLSDDGRIHGAFSIWVPSAAVDQTTYDPGVGLGAIGLVIDQANYDHTPGAENIAEPYNTNPYTGSDDFSMVSPLTMVIDDPTMDKSIAAFNNTGIDTGDPYDMLINQTAWTVKNRYWAILQWKLSNMKPVDLTDVGIGLEVSISQVGAHGGIGYDSGDDIDGFDNAHDVYWARDIGTGFLSNTTIGFGSAIVNDPISHYYAEDYHPATYDDYKVLWENETWLYQRLHASNATATDGVNPGNITATIGWNDFTIPSGASRTVTLVVAINRTYDTMIAAMNEARAYYNNVLTGYQITEVSDSGLAVPQNPQIEVYNNGRGITYMSEFTLTSNSGTLTGTWSKDPLPPYEHSILTVTGGTVDPEGDIINLNHAVDGLADRISFGQEGVVPDPLDGESTARRYVGGTTNEYVNEWLRDPTPTFGLLNDVSSVISEPSVVINRVMFNPTFANEGYIELMYKGSGALDISNYRIICDKVYTVPGGTSLSVANRFLVLTQPNYPANYDPTASGDNVYLYDAAGNLLDMVGWSSVHNQGYYMSRSPDGSGTYQGYNDASSQVASWFFDQVPSMTITEFSDGAGAQVEAYNPRGGLKVLDNRWELRVSAGGTLTGSWSPGTILVKGYSTFTRGGGATLGTEGDTIGLYYTAGLGSSSRDAVPYGVMGQAPDPITGESTAKYWNTTVGDYDSFWNRETIPTFGAQNDVPYRNYSSFVILNEVMFNPAVAPDDRYLVLINHDPTQSWQVNVENFIIVCDDEFVIPVVGGIWLAPGDKLYIAYDGAIPELVQLFSNMNSNGDNIYFFDPSGRLLDQVGWNSAHMTGMAARRVPDGNGTYQGYNDASSTAAGWVFDQPYEVLITEVSDSGPPAPQIEVYNPIYPNINFGAGGIFTFEDETGTPISGTWSTPIAGPDGYAVFQVSSALNQEAETIRMLQNGILVDEIGYGMMGPVPDPLTGESVQRIRDPNTGHYTDSWSRNWTTGKNIGSQNDVPPVNITSKVVLNEVLFNPTDPQDKFVELYLRTGTMEEISGFKIVGDAVFQIPPGTRLDIFTPFYYMVEQDDPGFFSVLNPSGDNVYLYDKNGSIIDMVGWSSAHTVNRSMTRLPDGNGTTDGYDDASSEAAGWTFDKIPTYTIVLVETDQQKWGDPGWFVWYSMNVTNIQPVTDYVDLFYISENGWSVEFFEGDMVTPLVDKETPPDGLPDTGPLPPSTPYPVWVKVNLPFPPIGNTENTTIYAQSSLNPLGKDDAVLQTIANPYVVPNAYIEPPAPTTIYEKSAGMLGLTNETTVTLNATGSGQSHFTGQDVVFVLDSSGSMVWNDPDPDGIPCNFPFPQRVQASWNYVDMLNIEDRGSFVDFDGMSTLMVNLTEGTNHTYLKMGDPLMGGQPGLWCSDQNGATTIYTALEVANQELIGNGLKSHVWVEILLTDAEQIAPFDDLQSRMQADYAAANGIVIFTIGLGVPPGSGPPGGEDLLTYVASRTGGQYFSAPSAGALVQIFDQIFSMVRDIAGYNPTPGGGAPITTFVLEHDIDYIPGSFELVPGTIEVDPNPDSIIPGPTETILFWEWPGDNIRIGEYWSVTFDISCAKPGSDIAVNRVPDSSITYLTAENNLMKIGFPQVNITCLPPPLQPIITDAVVEPGDVLNLTWNPVIGAELYEIYGGLIQTTVDLTSVVATVPAPQTWWHDTSNLALYDEYYYVIKAVDTDTIPWTRSVSSNTAGFFRVGFPYGANGLNTFSLPLQPFNAHTLDWYLNNIPSTITISWFDDNDDWQAYPSTSPPLAEVGRGYVLEVSADSSFVFTGEPASMIRYTDEYGWDFDSSAQVVATLVGSDVQLTWPSLGDGIEYYVYRSTARGGFFSGGYAVLNGGAPVAGTVFTDSGAVSAAGEYYYMVVPYNTTLTRLGSSTYSIGVITFEYNGNDLFGLPLLPVWNPKTADWLTDQIPNAEGIVFLENGIWKAHFKNFPEGVYDTTIERGRGYEISVIDTSICTYVGW